MSNENEVLKLDITTSYDRLIYFIDEHMIRFAHRLEVNGLSTSTAKQYASIIRGMLKHTDIRDEANFNLLLENYVKSSHSMRRSAYRAYIRFLGGVPLIQNPKAALGKSSVLMSKDEVDILQNSISAAERKKIRREIGSVKRALIGNILEYLEFQRAGHIKVSVESFVALQVAAFNTANAEDAHTRLGPHVSPVEGDGIEIASLSEIHDRIKRRAAKISKTLTSEEVFEYIEQLDDTNAPVDIAASAGALRRLIEVDMPPLIKVERPVPDTIVETTDEYGLEESLQDSDESDTVVNRPTVEIEGLEDGDGDALINELSNWLQSLNSSEPDPELE